MLRFRGSRRRSLGFESLETRQMLAGNVNAFVFAASGNLNINGDNEANAVDVTAGPNPGEVWVTPLNGTLVNAGENGRDGSEPLLLTGLTGGLRSDLAGGNDELSVHDIAFAGDGVIYGRQGADKITLGAYVPYGTSGNGAVSFGSLLRMDEQGDTSATDNDTYFLGRLTVGRIDIHTGLGADTVTFYDVRALGSTTTYTTVGITTEDGSDVINLAYTTVYGNMRISADTFDSGNDLVSIITSVVHGTGYIDTWNGYNTVALNANQFLQTLEIYTEMQDDTITLTNSFFNKKVTIASFHISNNGNDTVRIEGNTFSERLYVSTCTGNDYVVVQNNQIVSCGLIMGPGSDTLTLRNNIFYCVSQIGTTEINGADGYSDPDWDVLLTSGNLFYGVYGYYYWEAILP
jgi:hypothetical protein